MNASVRTYPWPLSCLPPSLAFTPAFSPCEVIFSLLPFLFLFLFLVPPFPSPLSSHSSFLHPRPFLLLPFSLAPFLHYSLPSLDTHLPQLVRIHTEYIPASGRAVLHDGEGKFLVIRACTPSQLMQSTACLSLCQQFTAPLGTFSYSSCLAFIMSKQYALGLCFILKISSQRSIA